jgi:iron complex outermembrane receptor protein
VDTERCRLVAEWRHVLLMSALALSAPLPMGMGAVLAAPPVEQAQAARVIAFNIPPQDLDTAMTRLADQAGIRLLGASSDLAGKRTNGLTGNFTVTQALNTMLAGSGVGWRFSDANTVLLERLPQSSGALQVDPLQVQGYSVPQQAMIDNIPPPYAGGQVATGGQLGILGNRDIMDTPFNQTSFTSKKAQDQQARSVREVLIDDPSVRFYVPDGGVGAELINIRGFNVQNSAWTYGGLFGLLPTYSVMPEMAERMEVLKGPSAMLNGISPSNAIGGTVNVVPKRAADTSLTQLTASYASASQFGAAADIGRRFGEDKQFGVRFNGVFRAGQTDIQYNSDQRMLGVLGLDYRGDRVRASVDLGYQYEYVVGVVPYIGLAAGVQLPWAPNIRNNPGAQPWSSKETKDLFGAVRAEVDMLETVTAYASLGFHDSRFGQVYGTDIVTVTNFNGTSTGTSAIQNSYTQVLTGEAGVRARATTGPINHEIVASGSFYESANGVGTVFGPAYATNIYNTTVIARPSMANPAANKTGTQSLQSLAIADTLSAADNRIQLTAGLRLQQVSSTSFNAVTGARTTSYDQSALSPSVALVFKPWQNVSLYGNFIQGLQQGSIVPATFRNAGEVFAPFKATQYEVGVKVDWGKFTTTASLFQITQPSVITNVATNTQELAGEQRNQGLELNVFGEPLPGVRLLAGAMFLNALLTKTTGGATDGWTAPFSPGLQLRAAGEWDLPFLRGFSVNGRVVYTSSQYIDTTLPRRSLPDWTRFDVGFRYVFDTDNSPTGNPVALRFNIENLFDANYWAGGSGATTLFLGAPRTFRLSLTADF